MPNRLKNRKENDLTIEEFSDYLFVKEEVDLMIRTSGEVRLSNFLLWQVAYSEFIFTPVPWPEFDRQCLIDCIKEFNERDRRYGGLNS